MQSLAARERVEPLYSVGDAARLLEIKPFRLRRWLEGASIRGVAYALVIRPRPTAMPVH